MSVHAGTHARAGPSGGAPLARAAAPCTLPRRPAAAAAAARRSVRRSRAASAQACRLQPHGRNSTPTGLWQNGQASRTPGRARRSRPGPGQLRRAPPAAAVRRRQARRGCAAAGRTCRGRSGGWPTRACRSIKVRARQQAGQTRALGAKGKLCERNGAHCRLQAISWADNVGHQVARPADRMVETPALAARHGATTWPTLLSLKKAALFLHSDGEAIFFFLKGENYRSLLTQLFYGEKLTGACEG